MDSMLEEIDGFSINDSTFKTIKNNSKLKYESYNESEYIDSVNKLIMRPFQYLTSIPGKNIRTKLIEVLNYWMKIPQDKMERISQIVHNLHNFSLLIDDIQDRSILRRGVPAAHTVFGTGNTIISADYVNFTNVQECLDLLHPEAVRVYTNSTLTILAGQGMEIYWRENVVCPTEEDYLQMVTRKTGGIFLLAKNLMELFSTRGKDMDRFLINLGLYFQINDDYQNLNSEIFFDSKGFCEDLSEGKFGFPLVHAINTHPDEGKKIMNILRQRTYDEELKKYCISLIEKCGSFEYTRKKIKELRAAIAEDLEKLERNPFFDGFFAMIISASV